jgi:protein phosphatase
VAVFEYGNAQHIGRRQSQQDSFGFSDPGNAAFVDHAGFLAVVADGMGGLAHGEAASRLAVREFLDGYGGKAPAETIPAALLRSVVRAHEGVCRVAERERMPEDVGTTLAAAVVFEGTLHWISVGDSAVLLFRDGTFTQLNTPHTYAVHLDREVNRGLISQDAAQEDPQREALVSYLGARDLCQVDRTIRPFPLRPGDEVFLASDGLFKVLGSDEMIAAMGSGLQASCESLVAAAIAKVLEDQDNITVVGLSGAARQEQPAPAAADIRPRVRFNLRAFWLALPAIVALAVGGILWFRAPRQDEMTYPRATGIAPLPGGTRYNFEKIRPSWQQRAVPETGEVGNPGTAQ